MRTIIEMIISCHSFIFKKRDKDPEKSSDFLKFSQKDSDKVLHLHLLVLQSSVLSKIILWTEELGDLQSMGSQRIRQK